MRHPIAAGGTWEVFDFAVTIIEFIFELLELIMIDPQDFSGVVLEKEFDFARVKESA